MRGCVDESGLEGGKKGGWKVVKEGLVEWLEGGWEGS